jgi:hypothetical protein
MKRIVRLSLAALLVLCVVPPGPVLANNSNKDESASSSCSLGNGVQHVINVVFDNTHFTRDNPNVPSDLEQMPALLNFLQGQGSLLTNEHTPLIAHTATDILTALTGSYGDNMGVPISNTFRYYLSNGNTNTGVSFAYWTAPVFDPSGGSTDTTTNMLTAQGLNAPAPWVPFTRAGCNVGGVGVANLELENTAIDIPTVFGPGSTQAAEVTSNPAQAFADFVGIAVHCAQSSALCSNANHGVPDLLPQEPGGYSGYQGLFGHTYVAPKINPGSSLKDLAGNVIGDTSGHVGFPGFDGMTASVSLSYVAAMQEHGVPVTYAYISDGHQKHPGTVPWGPGEAGYVAQLADYNQAFATFFARLALDGINRSNTLFTFTADEGDHVIAGPPTPANCDGVNVPCTYAQIGEVAANIRQLIINQTGITTPFLVHSDSAPNFYITGNPSQTLPITRNLERAAGTVTAVNPYSGVTEQVSNYLADQAEMGLLHMMTADRKRDSTFTMFAKPDYFLSTFPPTTAINPAFNWNHGDIAPDINVTWLGLVGPDVKNLGVTDQLWTDHADIRPTILALTGLHEDYIHQGRPISQVMTETRQDLNRLADVYKQINAPVGQLSLDSIRFATSATLSTSTGDQTYMDADAQIAAWTSQRNALADQMIALLDTTAPGYTNHNDRNVNDLIRQGEQLLAEVHAAAA